MSTRTILIAEDDAKTAETVRLYLEREGYSVVCAATGPAAIDAVERLNPDLIVLDLMLPEIDGLSVCRRIRQVADPAVVMLTARSTEEDTLRGLEVGADDYVTKPFSPRELVARIRAVLRRTVKPLDPRPHRLVCGDIEIDQNRKSVTVAGEATSLTPTEFKLLETFCRAPGRVFTRAELIQSALGWEFEGLDRTIDAHVANLRRKIDTDRSCPSRIETYHGLGYALRLPDAG